MTREQAIESLSWLKTRLSVGLGGMDKLSPHYKDMVDEVQSIALAIAALRGPQPDPDTGLVPCGWCGPERIGWFSVQFWVRACYGKRKWMSVTQDWKKKVKYCPMCGRKLEGRQ